MKTCWRIEGNEIHQPSLVLMLIVHLSKELKELFFKLRIFRFFFITLTNRTCVCPACVNCMNFAPLTPPLGISPTSAHPARPPSPRTFGSASR